MIVPNAEHAVVDIRKLREYCLSMIHPRGKQKALVFLTALGLSANDADELREMLLSVVRTHEAIIGERDE